MARRLQCVRRGRFDADFHKLLFAKREVEEDASP